MNASTHVLRSNRRCQIAALCGAVLSFGTAVAQPAADNVPATVEAALTSWVDAFNHGRPTAAYFAREAVLVRGNGTFRGAAVIDDMEQRESKAGLRLTLKVDQVQFIGPDAAAVVSRYTVALPGPSGQIIPGVSLHMLQRAGDQWLVGAASFTRVQAPPSTSAAAMSNTQK
jgi:hypothetical protein